MALNRVVENPRKYKPQIDPAEAASNQTDQNRVVKLMEKVATVHHQLGDILEGNNLDILDMREAFTAYGETVSKLYAEMIDD
jgi:hypothetical protein